MRLNHHFRRGPFLLLSIAGAALTLVGCSSNPQLVENLPPPNFSGPSVAPQPAPAPAQQTRAPVPTIPYNPTRRQPQVVTGAVPREWLPPAGASRDWKWIVIHHSATASGSARMFDRMHRDKGWDELGYHFVIGNGTESGDGQVEVGPRWNKQKWGAHAKTPDNQFNDFGIGICLVGNFDIERPTAQQTRSLARLVAHLMKTYDVPASRVLGHMDTGKPTECPGRNLNVAAIRRLATQMAGTHGPVADETQVAGLLDAPAAGGFQGDLTAHAADDPSASAESPIPHAATEP